MVAKGNSGEEQAWKEYLTSIEGKQATTKKKRIPISEMVRKILQRIGIGKKAREAREVEKQIAISAAEGRKISRKKPAVGKKLPATKAFGEEIKRLEKGLARVEKEEMVKGKPLRIEKYLEMVEERRKAEAEKRAREEKPAKAIEKKQAAREEKKPAKAIEKKVAKVVERGKRLAKRVVPKKVLMLPTARAGRKLVISKKVAFLPRAKKARKAIAKRKKVVLLPRAKRKKAAGKTVAKRVMRGKARRKPMRLPKMAPVRGKELAVFLGERPSLVEKSVSEIKKLSKKEVKKGVRLERIASRARGWYGEALRHQRAALAGWRIRKKVRLHYLRKKVKEKKLTLREQKEKKALLSEDREARQRIKELDARIVALKRIAREKGEKRRLLEKKVKTAGVKIPKAKISPIERGRARFRKRSEMLDLVDAMRSVADEMAATATKQKMAGVGWTDALTLKDHIRAQQKLIKSLERAFYKRKISFEQFREKMFEYQSKLSEMKIKKKIIEKRMSRLAPEMKEAIRKKALLEQKVAKQAGVGITPKAAKAPEKFAEKEVEREAKKAEEKKFAERTAEALQKIAERLGAMPKPVPQPPKPSRPAPKPPQRREEEAYVPRRPARKPVKKGGMERIRKAIEEEERKEAEEERRKRKGKIVKKAKEKKPKERIVKKAKEKKPKERIIERVKEKILGEEKAGREKPKVSNAVDKAIKKKAAGSGISKQQIDKVEEKLGELLEKYNIPDSALAAHIRTLDSNTLVQDFQKLIHMIEAKKESATGVLIRPAPGFDIKTGIITRKREKIVGKEREIRYAKIETSFDKVLRLVQVKGVTNLNEVARQLGMSKKETQECAEVLERSRLIKLRYPPIGAVKLIYPGYLKWKAQEKKKRREEKRRKKKR